MKFKPLTNLNHKKLSIFLSLYSVFIICLTFILLKTSYSRYITDMNVSITSNTGEMICDIEVDTNSNYIESNIPYFIIKVHNYKTVDGEKILTSTDIDYKITITNLNNSNGLFYIDYTGNSIGTSEEYASSVMTDTLSFGRTEETKQIRVFVKASTGLKEKVDFNVNLDAIQKQMD